MYDADPASQDLGGFLGPDQRHAHWGSLLRAADFRWSRGRVLCQALTLCGVLHCNNDGTECTHRAGDPDDETEPGADAPPTPPRPTNRRRRLLPTTRRPANRSSSPPRPPRPRVCPA